MKPLTNTDLESVIAGGGPVILELGSGQRRTPGRIHVDKVDLPGVDVVADLEDGLPFLPDRSVDEIHCRSVLEHVENFEALMAEIVRVLKDDGTAHVFVPHFSNPYYYSDYTHRRFFGLYSFYYFVAPEKQLRRKVPAFYTATRIEILSQRLVFRSSFRLLKPLKKLIGWFLNLHTCMQQYYEENLCYLLPCHGVELVFRPDRARERRPR
jgi:ubiquinone/menaquinone biosynthesis C-methylase UbiE